MKEKIDRLRNALIALGAKRLEVTQVNGEDTVCVKALVARGAMHSNFWYYIPASRVLDTDPSDLAAEVFSVLRAEADSVFDQLCVR